VSQSSAKRSTNALVVIVWNDVGVRASRIVSEVAGTAGTCAIGVDHIILKKRERF
jgi:hypothetical protein